MCRFAGEEYLQVRKLDIYLFMIFASNTWIDNVIKEWTGKCIKIQKGASLELISAIEQMIEFIFPEQVQKFYLRVNGFNDWEYNENLFSIWSLERILKEHDESNDKTFV